MFTKTKRIVVVMCSAVTMLAAPAESQACWLTNWCRGCFAPRTTYYAPPPVCNPCPQTVSYVPQTAYRTAYTCQPCTTYRPVTTCDPCTGCPQTVMQPVTTYVQRPVMVPYTTYRPVFAAAATPCCGTAPAASPYYQPAGAVAPAAVVAPSAGCCGGAAPAATYVTPSPGYSTTPGAIITTPQPSLAPTPAPITPEPNTSTSPPTTFVPSTPSETTPTESESRRQGNGTTNGGSSNNNDSSTNGSTNGDAQQNSTTVPQLLNPNDRTTSRPSGRVAVYRPAHVPQAIQTVSHTAPVDNDGWRPAK